MDNRKSRFGLVGAGNFGPELAPYISQVADLVAVCYPRPEARAHFRRETGLSLAEFGSHERLLAAGDVDAIAITSLNDTHKEITLAAARAGKHVFCEKPMALTVPNCWAMVRACEAAGVRLMLGHKRRLRPPWARMIALRQELSTVVAIWVCLYHDAWPRDFRGWWTQEAQCGGILSLRGVHTIDWMRAMCGDVAAVQAVFGSQIDVRYDFPDTLHLSLQFHSGAVASLAISLAYALLGFRESGGPLVICREGDMRLIAFLDHIDLDWQRNREPGINHERFAGLGYQHAFLLELGDFVRWVAASGKSEADSFLEPCQTCRQGLRCVEVMEAAQRSAKAQGAPIELPLYSGLAPSGVTGRLRAQ